jgi:hypothetical protein
MIERIRIKKCQFLEKELKKLNLDEIGIQKMLYGWVDKRVSDAKTIHNS